MISEFYGKSFTQSFLCEKCYIDKAGVSLKGISEAAELIGFRTLAVKIPFDDKQDLPCLTQSPLPVIVHWNQYHFVVVFKITKKTIWIADPEKGKIKLTHKDFVISWLSDGDKGVALLLETTPELYSFEIDE